MGDFLEGKEDIQAALQEAAGAWSDVKQTAVSGLGGGSPATEEGSTGLGWEALQREAEKAARGVFGDVSTCSQSCRNKGVGAVY